MASSTTRPSSRYSAYDSRSSTSSHFFDPSSSSEFNHEPHSSRALVKAKPDSLTPSGSRKAKFDHGLTTMVKKLMEKKPSSFLKPKMGSAAGLVIPSDVIAGELKKNARKVTGLTGLQMKLFGKGTSKASDRKRTEEVKALTGVKENTRTLAMVLRSERELLNMNKEQELEIAQLRLMIEERNRELPSQLQELLEKQGTELNHAKQIIPTLQKQVTSLTGRLQSLAEDLAEVKPEKYTTKTCSQSLSSSPRTPSHLHEDASDSQDFSSVDLDTPGSSDDLFLKDMNPCLTPYSTKTRYQDQRRRDAMHGARSTRI